MSTRSVARRLMVSLAVFAAGLVAFELALERWFPIGGSVYRLDRDLLHDARADAARIQPMPKSTLGEGDAAYVRVATGREGFRGQGLDLEGKRPRLLVMGDSLVMAENVPIESTFVEQLARALERELGLAQDAIEAVNAGRSGFGPDQALLLFERIAPVVQPDVIVFVVCAHNDLGDLARNKLFSLEGGALVRRRPRVSERIEEWFLDRTKRAARPALVRAFDAVRAGPALEEVVGGDPVPLYLSALDQQWGDTSGPRAGVVDSLFEDIYDADIALGVDVSDGAKAELLTAIAREVLKAEGSPRRFGLDRAVPVHFVVVPSAIDVCRHFGLQIDPELHPGYDPERLASAAVAALAGADSGSVHDLDGFFRRLEDPDGHFVGGTDIHWNARGQRAAARRVAAELVTDPEVAAALRERAR